MPVVTDGDGRRWLRLGECSRCGECCSSGDPFNGTRGVGTEPGCPLQRRDDQGRSVCLGYGVDSYQQNGCALWPSQPEHIEPYSSCTYSFVEV